MNTMYFERNGGYEYAKQFYEEAYHFIEEKFGADNVISAVMHADEINVAATEELGKTLKNSRKALSCKSSNRSCFAAGHLWK